MSAHARTHNSSNQERSLACAAIRWLALDDDRPRFHWSLSSLTENSDHRSSDFDISDMADPETGAQATVLQRLEEQLQRMASPQPIPLMLPRMILLFRL